jgi:hypothetical protein
MKKAELKFSLAKAAQRVQCFVIKSEIIMFTFETNINRKTDKHTSNIRPIGVIQLLWPMLKQATNERYDTIF